MMYTEPGAMPTSHLRNDGGTTYFPYPGGCVRREEVKIIR